MAFERKMNMKIQATVLPQSVAKVLKDLDKFSKDASKQLNKLFDFGSVFKDITKKFTSLFEFRMLDDVISKLKSNMSNLFSSIKDGFNGATGQLQKVTKWFSDEFKVIGKLIGKQLAVDMKTQISGFTSWFKENKDELKESFNTIAKQIGHILSSFAKGLIAVINMGKQFVEWFDRLPQGIKAATAAVLALWAVIKTGPVGILTTIITLAGDVIKDYNNYKNNQERGLQYGQDGYVDVALKGIWQIMDGQGTFGDRLYDAAGRLVTGLTSSITDWIDTNGGQVINVAQQIVDWLKDIIIAAANFISGAGATDQATTNFRNSLSSFVSQLIRFGLTASSELGSTVINAIIQSMNGMTSSQFQSAFESEGGNGGNSISGAIATGFVMALKGASPAVSIVTAIASFITNAPKDAGGNTTTWDFTSISAQINDFAAKLVGFVVGALGEQVKAVNFVTEIFRTMFKAFLGNDNPIERLFTEGTEQQKKNAQAGASAFLNGIIGGFAGYILSGKNILVTILGSLVGTFGQAIVDAFNDSEVQTQNGIDWNKFLQKIGANSVGTLQGLKSVGLAIAQLIINGIGTIDDIVGMAAQWIVSMFDFQSNTTAKESVQNGIRTGLQWLLGTILTGDWLKGLLLSLGLNIFSLFGQAQKQIRYQLRDPLGLTPDGQGSRRGAVKKIEDYTQDDWMQVLGLTWDKIKQMGASIWGIFNLIIDAAVEFWQQNDIGGQLAKWWNGDVDGAGNEVGNGAKKYFRAVLSFITGGVSQLFIMLWQLVQPYLNQFVSNIAYTIQANPTLAKILSMFGFKSNGAVRVNSDGTLTFAKGGKQTIALQNNTLDNGMTTYDMLTAYGQYIDVTSDGRIMLANSGGTTATQYGRASNLFAQAYNAGYGQQVLDIFQFMAQKNDTVDDFWGAVNTYTWGRSSRQGAQLFGSHIGMAGIDDVSASIASKNSIIQGKNNANAEAPQVQVQAQADEQTLRSSVQTVLDNMDPTLKVRIQNINDATDQPGSSQGGRITSPSRRLVGEDGTQYIIPVSKPNRAINLIGQMVTQMGGQARMALMSALGLTGGLSTIGGSMLNGSSITGQSGINIVYNNNVSAPVTINVHGTSESSKASKPVYSGVDRALLRTIQAVSC